jgi:hypothetical protein
MEVDGGLFQVVVTQQHLDAAQIRTCFEQVSGKTMSNGVRVHVFFDARSLGGIPAGMPNHFRSNRPIAVMVPVAWKQPLAWFSL